MKTSDQIDGLANMLLLHGAIGTDVVVFVVQGAIRNYGATGIITEAEVDYLKSAVTGHAALCRLRLLARRYRARGQ